MIKQAIKTALWIISVICLYTIITIQDPRGFGIVAAVGFICTWVLFRWEKFEEYLDDE